MERVLVTGGTGFLGQHLVRALLARGERVRVLVRDPASNLQPVADVEYVGGTVLDRQSLIPALVDVGVVYHLAGRLLIPGVAEREYQRVHIEGTANLLAACAEAGPLRAIVHCSTTGVLGPTGAIPANEDAPMRPSNRYERSKAAGEQLAAMAAQAYDLPLVIARPALVYGPGDLHLLGWFRTIQRGYYRVVGSGENLFHPIYIDDLVEGLLRCATVAQARGRIYHLVGERPLPIRVLAAAIAQALGRRLPRQHIPLAFARACATVFEAIPALPPARLPLTQSRIDFMTESRAYCGDRARAELGFCPKIDLPTGMQRTAAWYRAQSLV